MTTYLLHYGIKGMKWGVRNYQNKDGTYTELGKSRRNEQRKRARYSVNDDKLPSTRHVEKKALSSTRDDVAREGEFWYNQNREMLPTWDIGDSHHEGVSMPNSVAEYAETKKGKQQVNRILYDSKGVMADEIHGGPHGSRKHLQQHSPDGAHRHPHDENHVRLPDPPDKHGYDLTEEERREHRAILKK